MCARLHAMVHAGHSGDHASRTSTSQQPCVNFETCPKVRGLSGGCVQESDEGKHTALYFYNILQLKDANII